METIKLEEEFIYTLIGGDKIGIIGEVTGEFFILQDIEKNGFKLRLIYDASGVYLIKNN